MKKIEINLIFIIFLFLLSSCIVYDPYSDSSSSSKIPGKVKIQINDGKKKGNLSSSSLSSRHISDVAKIRGEANRLSMQVSTGSITKVQAAKLLNNYRLNLVGDNIVDDSVYEVYLNAAIDSQKGVITSQQSKMLIKESLEGWRDRWSKMSDSDKPSNPAFTNFLMEFMGMDPLN